MGYKSNIPAHNLTNPGFNLISKVIDPVTFINSLEGKNHLQIMVLNLTRYPNSLLLMSQYIAEEQNLLANFQKDNKFERLLSSYSQVTIKFKPNLKTKFLKTKLLSSSLLTVVVKPVYFLTRFVYQLAHRYFSRHAAKLFFTFSKTSPVFVRKSCQAVWSLGPVMAIVWLLNTSV